MRDNLVVIASGKKDMKRSGIILKRVGIMFLGVLIPLVAVEIFMRVLDVGKSVKFDSTFDRPAVSYLPDGEGRLHPWSRGETNIFRIAVIGDSFTLGSGCQWDDSYPWRLQRLLNLNEGVRPAEVRVFAKAGTSTEVQLSRFFKPMLEWRPDLLILCIYLNDTENWADRATLNSMREPMNPRVPGPRVARRNNGRPNRSRQWPLLWRNAASSGCCCLAQPRNPACADRWRDGRAPAP